MDILGVNHAAAKETRILPNRNVYVKKEPFIMWQNESDGDVRITFGEGTKCEEITKAALKKEHFIVPAKGCYVTSPISNSGYFVVRFAEPGTYTYTVEFLKGEPKETGTIKVY